MARKPIQGLAQLNKKLAALNTEIRRDIGVAMELGAQDIVNFAKTLAPVGQVSGVNSSNNPGALRDSIGWVWGPAPKGTITLGTMRSNPRGKDDMYITIYAGNEEAFYARWVEFGTRPHGIDAVNAPTMGRAGVNFGKHVNHPGAKQTAFFYPAYRSMRTKVRRRISRAVNTAARKVVNS